MGSPAGSPAEGGALEPGDPVSAWAVRPTVGVGVHLPGVCPSDLARPPQAQAPERLSFQDLQLYLSNLAHQIDRGTGTGDVPLVVLLDDLSEAGSISELVNGALTCKYHKW